MKTLGLDTATKKRIQQEVQRDTEAAKDDPTNVCATCSQPAAAGTQLKTCARCRAVKYCSRECQQAGWKDHKKQCGKSEGAIGSVEYFVQIAHTKPEASELAKSLNITIPTKHNEFKGLMHTVRRLVVTGNDTPENMRLLFGTAWTTDVAPTLKDARMQVLLNPPRGSPSYAFHASMDVGAPTYDPRPATPDEQIRIDQVREMQAKVRGRLGNRLEPAKDDMMAILMQYGANWDQMLSTYTVAVNTMNQGVTPPP